MTTLYNLYWEKLKANYTAFISHHWSSEILLHSLLIPNSLQPFLIQSTLGASNSALTAQTFSFIVIINIFNNWVFFLFVFSTIAWNIWRQSLYPTDFCTHYNGHSFCTWCSILVLRKQNKKRYNVLFPTQFSFKTFLWLSLKYLYAN